MTCIVGIKTKEGVYIGGDSMGSTTSICLNRNDTKVFKNGEFIIGYTSSFRMGQLLRYNLNVKKQEKGISDYRYMCTTFVDSVRECLKVGGYASITNNEESGGVFLVAYKGNLYEIEGDFQVAINKDGYACCGSGMYYAYGSIYTSIKNKQTDIKKILKIALDSATNFNPFVGGSYKILFQKR